MVSCGTANSTKKVYKKPIKKVESPKKLVFHQKKHKTSSLAKKIINKAENYLGTPYRLGGMTHSGMDCSGLLFKVFEENQMTIARRSIDQAKEGREVSVSNVMVGDLLFFATSGGGRVSHSGIVYSLENEDIKFIHASTSKGVIISSLNETYWQKSFLFARRMEYND